MAKFIEKLRETAYVRLLVDERESDVIECDVVVLHSGAIALVVRDNWQSVGMTAGQILAREDIHSVRYYGTHRDTLVAAGYPFASDNDSET